MFQIPEPRPQSLESLSHIYSPFAVFDSETQPLLSLLCHDQKETQMTASANKAEAVLKRLHQDAQNDYARVAKGIVKSIFRPMQPEDFRNAYLPISREQGLTLQNLILRNGCREVVEFGTSFGISTIYLARAVKEIEGKVVTTELLESKVQQARNNIAEAGLGEYVEFRVGDAMETLRADDTPIDFLFLDGWKDLYLPLFMMLERRFHAGTMIYADNMDMSDTRPYADYVMAGTRPYSTSLINGGKAYLTKLTRA